MYWYEGALGNAVISQFKSHGWETVSVDFSHSENASHSVVITGSSKDDVSKVIEDLHKKNLSGKLIPYTIIVHILFDHFL